jgi:hypothetical protein
MQINTGDTSSTRTLAVSYDVPPRVLRTGKSTRTVEAVFRAVCEADPAHESAARVDVGVRRSTQCTCKHARRLTQHEDAHAHYAHLHRKLHLDARGACSLDDTVTLTVIRHARSAASRQHAAVAARHVGSLRPPAHAATPLDVICFKRKPLRHSVTRESNRYSSIPALHREYYMV